MTISQYPNDPGQISASMAAMHRTIDDYDSMAKREIIKAKQEKAQMYALYSLPNPQLTPPQARRKVPHRLHRPPHPIRHPKSRSNSAQRCRNALGPTRARIFLLCLGHAPQTIPTTAATTTFRITIPERIRSKPTVHAEPAHATTATTTDLLGAGRTYVPPEHGEQAG